MEKAKPYYEIIKALDDTVHATWSERAGHYRREEDFIGLPLMQEAALLDFFKAFVSEHTETRFLGFQQSETASKGVCKLSFWVGDCEHFTGRPEDNAWAKE
jgi:hypothetical protein